MYVRVLIGAERAIQYILSQTIFAAMEKEGIRVSYYDDEFYTELSEFDKQIEEMKASLASSVQKEFLGEMDALRLENESLREFRDKKKRNTQGN